MRAWDPEHGGIIPISNHDLDSTARKRFRSEECIVSLRIDHVACRTGMCEVIARLHYNWSLHFKDALCNWFENLVVSKSLEKFIELMNSMTYAGNTIRKRKFRFLTSLFFLGSQKEIDFVSAL